jgi:lauroyl/myristoyl acyltransferase
LPQAYSIEDYQAFMRDETYLFSPSYARSNVVIHGIEHLKKGRGGVLAFLHAGSFFLPGGPIVHRAGLPFTLIASRHNRDLLPPEEAAFWRGVHERSARLFGTHLFFSDEPPQRMVRWIKDGGYLGAALDVREIGRRQTADAFTFCDTKLFLHLGAARLALLAGKPLHAMSMVFDPRRRKHDLHIGPAIRQDSPHALIREALEQLAPFIQQAPNQLFHDLFGIFSHPPANI